MKPGQNWRVFYEESDSDNPGSQNPIKMPQKIGNKSGGLNFLVGGPARLCVSSDDLEGLQIVAMLLSPAACRTTACAYLRLTRVHPCA